MTREDINDVINAICPNDEDYEKPCISPKYLRQELEQLALDQKQWNGEPTTKNDLGVDREDAVERLNALKQLIGYDKDSEIVKATQKSLDMAISALEHPERNVVAIVPCGDTISRQAVLDLMIQKWGENFSGDSAMQESIDAIRVLPSVTPQEPFKPMVEIDLYSVIKQKYIEREVLDKIRAEIAEYGSIWVEYAITDDTKTDKGIEILVNDVLKQAKREVLQIIDKYKAESEGMNDKPSESEVYTCKNCGEHYVKIAPHYCAVCGARLG